MLPFGRVPQASGRNFSFKPCISDEDRRVQEYGTISHTVRTSYSRQADSTLQTWHTQPVPSPSHNTPTLIPTGKESGLLRQVHGDLRRVLVRVAGF